ncbi:hypothetical protein AC629_19835 [Bradyrhizobium sp. NAS80.1]|nr:hypothetical protein AC629_19835 [Bradyrhizobium sp. NAS80.1]
MFSQRNDILDPFAKRRQFAYETRDAMKEISAKLTASYHFQEVAIGSTNQAKLGSVPCAPAYTLIAAFLNDTQQLCLEGQRQFPHFVEKQGAAVCQRERPRPLRQRTRECPALMPKEFTARQLGYNGGTIQNHELAFVRSRIELMNEPSGDFLARTSLPENKHTRITKSRDLGYPSQRGKPNRAFGDDASGASPCQQLLDGNPAFQSSLYLSNNMIQIRPDQYI